VKISAVPRRYGQRLYCQRRARNARRRGAASMRSRRLFAPGLFIFDSYLADSTVRSGRIHQFV